jgi:hypothetical protein
VSNLLDNHDDSASVSNTNKSSWEHGWYVFENGQVVGPLNVQDALGKTSANEGDSVRMVSRKGFTQWYPVQDFAEIYAMIGSYSEQLNSVNEQVSKATTKFGPKSKIISVEANVAGNSANAQSSANAEQARENVVAEAETRVRAAQTEILGVNRSENASEGNLNDLSTTPADNVGSQRSPTIGRGDLREASGNNVGDLALANDPRTRKELRRQVQAAQAAARSQKLMDPALFAQHYFAVRGRLRLGRVFSPVVGALIYTPLTLGGYWWDWFARSSEEVSWHVNGSSKVNFVLPIWCCLIPGVHLILAYFLARMVSKMEMENGYRGVSPALATMLAIFPPFYILMIQSALNRHWRLHVYHSATPR